MGESLQLRLFQGGTAASFRDAVKQAAASLGGTIQWDQPAMDDGDLRLLSQGDVHTLYLPSQKDAPPFYQAIGRLLDGPWIELRTQAGSLWDYTLYRGTECVDTFSVAPEYWVEPEEVTEDYLRQRRGDPQMLATLWQIPLESIDRYIVSWGYHVVDDDTFAFHRKGKAYPTDKYEYGNPDQMDDMLQALGGRFPDETHTLVLPTQRR